VALLPGTADFSGAFGANFEGGETVGVFVDDVEKLEPKVIELVGGKTALENGILDAHPVVFTEFGDALEAFGTSNIVGDYG